MAPRAVVGTVRRSTRGDNPPVAWAAVKWKDRKQGSDRVPIAAHGTQRIGALFSLFRFVIDIGRLPAPSPAAVERSRARPTASASRRCREFTVLGKASFARRHRHTALSSGFGGKLTILGETTLLRRYAVSALAGDCQQLGSIHRRKAPSGFPYAIVHKWMFPRCAHASKSNVCAAQSFPSDVIDEESNAGLATRRDEKSVQRLMKQKSLSSV
jgi:hypothetical protein